MSGDFYRVFEEKFYAPRDYIKDLRRQYLPFVKCVAAINPGAPTFDIGCGRGEWLELMAENGFQPYGVDLDQGMLSACVERKLPAELGDAVSRLKSLEDGSQAIVSAFHVVEHLTFDELRDVVSEAVRVLRPGGLLIIETPNPENIFVATQNFYLDPTHVRPIPAPLLAFLCEYYGFVRVKLLRLQEDKRLFEANSLSLNHVLSGASPDYAVIGQKAGGEQLQSDADDPFAMEYGLSLEALCRIYDKQFMARIESVEALARQADSQSLQAEARAQDAEGCVRQVNVRVEHAEVVARQATATAQQVEVIALHAEAVAREAEVVARQAEFRVREAKADGESILAQALRAAEMAKECERRAKMLSEALSAVHASRSWRITAPMRATLSAMRRLFGKD